ncbi:thioredoxin family protein [Lederbergia sp. NSJ-179]|uniref:thioredoxin family protein n=1 Tax=Lederbergia sp. NSJ-179 TaxID=2931402 RepID=UPI001FD01AF0|nr:thioredoxin family protein [Lederbergia sp. NSJ-179]MCJ7840292.1 thioredoxin family protein [Lederbergia sp. NSJ-179]
MEAIQNQEMFDQVISSEKPVIIKFEADWCPDCKRLDMFIGEIIEEYQQFTWYEIDRDQFPELAEKYQVMGIPSLLIFQNGEKLAHLHSANAKTPEQVSEFLEQHS